MQVGKLAQRIDADGRQLKYLLERGHAERWVANTPGSGHHRELSGAEAFVLALLVKLTSAGLGTAKAERIVAIVEECVRFVGRGLVWDPLFNPFCGDLKTQKIWFTEVGDLKAVRLGTNANPSLGGKLELFPWVTLGKRRRELPDFRPCVCIRIDLSLLASLCAHEDEA